MSDHRRVRRRRRKPDSRFQTILAVLRRWPRRTDRLSWLAITAITGIAIWYLLFWLGSEGSRDIGYLNAGGYWYGVLALVAGVILAIRRHRLLAGIGVLLALPILWQGNGFALMARAPSADASHFRIVSASLRNMNNDMDSAARTLLAQHPDVIVVQEADLANFFAAITKYGGPGWSHADRENEMIVCHCTIAGSQTTDNILSTDLDLPVGRVRVWDMRAPKDYRDPIVNETYFAGLAAQMATTVPGLAVGDFNATPWNDGYRSIAAVAHDAWREGGFGPGFTFPTRYRRMGLLMPLIQIDHMFLTGNLRATRMRVIGASNGADHYPIVADITRN